eukprot:TRINITY_DN9723_c0_g2_i1.p1 TRINITY_DN9723_c0_g2~~TRINITY_DN9723_c0_g2_i1.p1  ORF type:complete len:153 (-),score=40.96 TRINITY_DN9723_c0_g2_i1:28-420(-)
MLANFYENLSVGTRQNYQISSYDIVMAQDNCDSIGKGSVHRFVLTLVSGDSPKIVGLFELCLEIGWNEIDRFKECGVEIKESDCRFGPCLSDEFQGVGVGGIAFEYVKEMAKKMGKTRIILWGGVFEENI